MVRGRQPRVIEKERPQDQVKDHVSAGYVSKQKPASSKGSSYKEAPTEKKSALRALVEVDQIKYM